MTTPGSESAARVTVDAAVAARSRLAGVEMQFGKAEVDDLRQAVRPHHHVFRFEIAMHDAGGVRHGEPLGNLLREVNRAAMRNRPGAELVAKRPALDPLHGEIRRVALAADVMNREDVRVIER